MAWDSYWRRFGSGCQCTFYRPSSALFPGIQVGFNRQAAAFNELVLKNMEE
jgi:hypothetical protein